MSDSFQTVGDPRTAERRQCPRQHVSFACVQLDEDNGGLVLDISERGLSLQAVAILTDTESPHMRFQLSPSQPWIEARGRIAWIGPSMKTAGLEFIGLPDESRDQIKKWMSLELQANESSEEITLKNAEPPKDQPGNVIPFPEPETIGPAGGNRDRYSIDDDAIEVPPSVDQAPQYSRTRSTTRDVTENARGTAAPLLTWSELEARVNREIIARKRRSFPPASGRLIGLSVGIVVLLSALFLLAYHLQKSTHPQQQMEAITPTKVPEPSTDTASPKNAEVHPTPPSDGAGFMLQVGAMTHKENADALAEALKRKYFPAFVSQLGTDGFYRVVVGPFKDADSTFKAKGELKEEGFEAIRMRLNPLAK
jgi:hypothetical protein